MSKDVEMRDLRGRNRFKLTKVLANTLQGRIYLAQDKTAQNQWAVVKETWRELVKLQKSRDGHRIPENFEREKEVQLYLSNLPEQNEGYVRCIENWEDENCYYLAMEYCGAGELFDFIRDNHTKGELSEIVKKASTQEQKCQQQLNAWSICVQSMFRQMVDTVSWMHRHHIAHLDLSLENTMLASIEGHKPKIKIIDFGLARRFKQDETFNEKVGKVGYMAPEVYARQNYLPEKADIWCLGVMLFMMLVGAPPYEFPNPTNPAFRFIISGRLRDVLQHWRRLPLVPTDALDVMEKIFKPEAGRITMEELRRHKFVGLPDITVKSNSNDEEMSDRKLIKSRPDANAKPRTFQNENFPSLKTQPAKEMVVKLKETVGEEDIRKLIKNMQETIEQLEKVSTKSHQNPAAEGVVDNQHNNDQSNESQQVLKELKQVFGIAKSALNRTDAT